MKATLIPTCITIRIPGALVVGKKIIKHGPSAEDLQYHPRLRLTLLQAFSTFGLKLVDGILIGRHNGADEMKPQLFFRYRPEASDPDLGAHLETILMSITGEQIKQEEVVDAIKGKGYDLEIENAFAHILLTNFIDAVDTAVSEAEPDKK